MLSIAILLIGLTGCAVADPYDCPTNTTITFNGTTAYQFLPADPHYQKYISCTWMVVVPDGYFASIAMVGNLVPPNGGDSSTVFLATSYGKQQWYKDNLNEIFLSLPPTAFLTLNGNGYSGTFTFTVSLFKQVPPQATNKIYTLPDNGYIAVDLIDFMDSNVLTIVSSTNTQVALAFGFDSLTPLADILLYDGFNVNGTALGPVGLFVRPDSDTVIWSTQHAFTMYYPLPKTKITGVAFANDYRNIAGLFCYRVSLRAIAPSPADNQYDLLCDRASAITYYLYANLTFVLQSVQNIDANDYSVSVVRGAPGGLELAKYRNAAAVFPQQFVNGVVTVIGNAEVNNSFTRVYGTTSDAIYDRYLGLFYSGFVFSDNFGDNTFAQYVKKTLNVADQRYTMTINFESVDFSHGETCTLMSYDGSTLIFNSTNTPPADPFITTGSLTVIYDSHGKPSSGLKLTYAVGQPPSTSTTSPAPPTTTSDSTIATVTTAIILAISFINF